jgi:hypothetical protein
MVRRAGKTQGIGRPVHVLRRYQSPNVAGDDPAGWVEYFERNECPWCPRGWGRRKASKRLSSHLAFAHGISGADQRALRGEPLCSAGCGRLVYPSVSQRANQTCSPECRRVVRVRTMARVDMRLVTGGGW